MPYYRLCYNERIVIHTKNKSIPKREVYLYPRFDKDVRVDILPESATDEYNWHLRVYFSTTDIVEGTITKLMSGLIELSNYTELFDGRYNLMPTTIPNANQGAEADVLSAE